MKKLVFFFSLISIMNNNDVIGFCDIKGGVEKPGVYEIRERDTINDVIIKAGGLKKDAYTDNINMSKIVKDEMVIYIHNNNEIAKAKELNNCICEPIIKYAECDINTTTTKPNLKDDDASVIYDLADKTLPTTKLVTEQTTSKLVVETTTKVISTNQTTESIILKININIADLNDLIKLDGLGESKAKNIIEYRKTNGSFKSIEELLNVDGIGKKTFENIKDFITI